MMPEVWLLINDHRILKDEAPKEESSENVEHVRRGLLGNPAIPRVWRIRPEFMVKKSVKNSAKIATLNPLE
jgi:hypothetical protein